MNDLLSAIPEQAPSADAPDTSPDTPSPPKPTWPERISSWLGKLHPEEKYVIALSLVGILVCHFFGKGFSFFVAYEYLMIFARHVGLYFMFSRVILFLGENWRPTGSVGIYLRRFLFGHSEPSHSLYEADVAFLRGFFLMFGALSVYSNIKIRIPFINAYTGDEFFKQLDSWIFGDYLWPWLTQVVRSDPEWTNFFQSLYSHDYMYMVILVLLLHMRRDLFAMRWCFASVGVLYISTIFITLLYPSLGPCFYEWSDWQWLADLDPPQIHQTQWSLAQTLISLVGMADVQPRIEAHAFYGIAAFPSLHCGHMVLLVVIAWFRYRIYTVVAATMAFLTFIATMAFGWHWAVDGVAGAAIAVVVPLFVLKIMQGEDGEVYPPLDSDGSPAVANVR